MAILTDRIFSGLVVQDQEAKANYKRKTGSVTASTIRGCRRANYYAIKSLKPDSTYEINPLVLSKFWDGKKAHLQLGEFLRACGIKIRAREVVSECRGIYIRFDYIIGIDDTDYKLEFKTMAEGPFNTFVRYGLIAFPGYHAQCQLMAGAEPNIPSLVLCKNKGTSDYMDEIIVPDWEFIDNLAKIKDQFDSDILHSKPPARDFEYHSTECAGCEYRVRCWLSKLRNEVLLEKDLNETEKKAVDTFYNVMEDNTSAYNEYLEAEGNLKNYVAFLHTKHAVLRVRLEGINSTSVVTHPQKYDMDYIWSILTEEQREKATIRGESRYLRTMIR